MRTHTAWIAIAAAGLWGGTAQAQDRSGGESKAESLPEVVAEGEQVAAPVTLGSGVNSGTTTIDRQDIQLRTPGSGDVNKLLRILPTVQFDRDDGIASQDSIQDIRPANISISGGHYYANNISLDGVNINSRLDVTNDNPQNGSEVAGPSAQTHWLDSELIGKITVFDSNVSAEHGNFTGGTVTIETRDPSRSFGITATASHTSDEFTNFKLSRIAQEQYEGTDLPATPKFEKWRYGGTVDLPLSDRAAVLVAYNHSESRVTHFANAKYGNAERRFRDISDNVLVKGIFDIDNATVLRGQFAYSPYSSTSSTNAAVDAVVDSRGGGITSKLELEHTGTLNWKAEGSYAYTDTSRTAPGVQYNIPSTTTNGAFCDNSSCTTGGIGDLDQTQRIYALKGTMGVELGDLALRGGVDYEHVAARKSRPEDVLAYSRGKLASNIVCTDGDSLDCAAGEYALEQYNYSKAYNAHVSLDSAGAWLEGTLQTGALTLRGGLRYDYESFLGNHVLAPRFAAAYRLPWNDMEISVGANRYYGTSMLSYALREQYPSTEIWKRTGVNSGGSLYYSDAGWALSSVSNATSYRNSNLETPYSDELTAAVTGRALGGVARLKGIYRDGKNLFARTPMLAEVSGGLTLRYYNMSNEGSSTYRGVSFEWERSFGKHSLGLSVNYSTTKRTNPDYLEDVDDELWEDLPILYDGNVYTSREIAEMNRDANYAAPLLINATWSAAWLADRLRSNVSVHYRNGFDRIEDTGVNQTIEGIRYDVYELVNYPDSVDVDLNLQADVIRSHYGTLTLTAEISNLFNTVPSSSYTSSTVPYQLGRSAWIGAKYRF